MDSDNTSSMDTANETQEQNTNIDNTQHREEAETLESFDRALGAAYPPDPDDLILYPELDDDGQSERGYAGDETLDHGLSAAEPIFPGGVLPAMPGVPQASLPLPPVLAMTGAPLFSASAFIQPGPTAGVPETHQFSSKDLPPTPAMVALLVTDERLHDFWKRADQAQKDVNTRINSLPIARTLLDQIQCARNEILAGREYIEEAERALNEVEYRILLSERVARWSYSIGGGLAIYEILLFVFAILGLLFAAPWLLNYVQVQAAGPASPTWPTEQWAHDIVLVFNSMMWGVLGGVTGALYALWIHIAREQDFDKQYTMWYLLSPVGGLVVGAFIFLVVRLGIFSLTAGQETSITSPLILYALAWLAGFQQNVVYDLVKSFLKIFKVET